MKTKKFLALGFVIILMGIFPGVTTAQEGRHAIVLKTEGMVEVKLSGDAWQPAKAGMTLMENDEIRSGQDGSAKILLDEEGKTGQFDLNPGSRLLFNTMKFSDQTEDKSTVLDLAVGSILVHAEKLMGDSNFQVRTPNSTTGVRGTTFLVSAEPKEA